MRNKKFLEFVCEHNLCAICRNFSAENKHDQFWTVCLKGDLQPQNKLISSKRPFKILKNDTKIVKIRQAVLEIFNFKDLDLNRFQKKRLKNENVVFRGFAKTKQQ